MELFVHDTAFMIAHYRAQQEDVSKDPYARLWLRPGIEKWTTDFADQVTPHDEVLHCLRNRLFFDELHSVAQKEQKVLFINLGAGFSMYPFMLPNTLQTIEVDFKEVIHYKQEKLLSFYTAGQLPKRNITFIALDITSKEGQKTLQEEIAKYPEYQKVIALEGVFFFLQKEAIQQLFTFFSKVLQPKDLVMCISYKDTIKDTAVFQRLSKYFKTVLESHGNPNTTLPLSFYQSIPGFQLNKQESELGLGKKLGIIPTSISEEEVLNEYFYLLERI